jgi:anti-sigma B factor antagonist
MNKFEISENNPNLAVIKLNKNVLGGNDALEFTSQLHELPHHNITKLVVDLTNVEVINSSGMGMLVAGLSSSKKNNIEFVLAAPGEKVLTLLEMTHLNKVFMIFDTVEKALK